MNKLIVILLASCSSTSTPAPDAWLPDPCPSDCASLSCGTVTPTGVENPNTCVCILQDGAARICEAP
jgi:hypothetical protein